MVKSAPAEPPRGSDLVLERLNRLHPKIIDLSLDRSWRLLERLGHPERRLPPVVHVAGTNGKGSVIAFLRAMLEAAGYRVHVYISPHLVRFHERIRLAGKLIEEPALLALLKECEGVNGAEPVTFFEITTCAAFLEFARTPADILLLETGLGGRLDSTNVIARPLASVLMPISFDHMQHLGDTLTKIAFEKAGIIKQDVPAVVGPQPAEASAVFETKAKELGAPLCRYGHEWQVEIAGEGILFTDRAGKRRLPRPALPGDHQIPNAGAALATLPFLAGFTIDERAQAVGDQPAHVVHMAQERARDLAHDLRPDVAPFMAQTSVTFATDRNLERTAVVEERALLRDALTRGMRAVSLAAVKAECEHRLDAGECVAVD
jgi:dihydrofolate synthase/folylpolyglutamate synthase